MWEAAETDGGTKVGAVDSDGADTAPEVVVGIEARW
jgi:hypothetical protein